MALHDFKAAPSPTETGATDVTPEQIAELADLLVGRMTAATTEIGKINDRTRLLSLNAQIEAARAGGSTGSAFGVVASAMQGLSDKTSEVARLMSRETADANRALRHIIETMATNVRGTRLSDLARTNIDLIDRNLYERSCDVRWWATDSSPVRALTEGSPEALAHCTERLGIILNSYTVYYDLVVCDLDGTVVANGRPERYCSVGTRCAGEDWFQSALKTRSGEEFGFQGLHRSPLVNGQHSLIYSCCVRANGDVQGQPRGVLGIVFNWDSLAQTIVENTPLSPTERAVSRICIVDDEGLILADSEQHQLEERMPIAEWSRLVGGPKGYAMTPVGGVTRCIGYAKSPGYETYATGWHSVILQKTETTP